MNCIVCNKPLVRKPTDGASRRRLTCGAATSCGATLKKWVGRAKVARMSIETYAAERKAGRTPGFRPGTCKSCRGPLPWGPDDTWQVRRQKCCSHECEVACRPPPPKRRAPAGGICKHPDCDKPLTGRQMIYCCREHSLPTRRKGRPLPAPPEIQPRKDPGIGGWIVQQLTVLPECERHFVVPEYASYMRSIGAWR